MPIPSEYNQRSTPSVVFAIRTLVALAICACGGVGARADTQTPPPGEVPIVGVHYQDVLPSDGDTIEVFLPRPHLATWDGVTLASSNDCAELGRLGDPGPDHVLVLEVTLRGDRGVLQPGRSCTATIVASYQSGTTTWHGATELLIHRLEHPPAPVGALEAVLTVDRILLGVDPGARLPGTLITLTLTNRAAAPLELLGLADEEGFASVVGSVYRYDDEFDGTLAHLEEVGRGLAHTTLAPGDSTNVALVLDPWSRLPDGSGVITVQPALIVSLAGTTHALRFERLSTTWGNELP